MLDDDFASLLDDDERSSLPREGALELSRLVVRPDITLRGHRRQPHPLEYVLRSLYQRCLQDNYRRFYIVVEYKWISALRRRFGLPFQLVGQTCTFADGTRTVAGMATLVDLENGVRGLREDHYQWYRQAVSTTPD